MFENVKRTHQVPTSVKLLQLCNLVLLRLYQIALQTYEKKFGETLFMKSTPGCSRKSDHQLIRLTSSKNHRLCFGVVKNCSEEKSASASVFATFDENHENGSDSETSASENFFSRSEVLKKESIKIFQSQQLFLNLHHPYAQNHILVEVQRAQARAHQPGPGDWILLNR